MNWSLLKILLFTIMSIALLSCPAQAKVGNDSIIAIVNNDIVTLKDLRQYIASIASQLKVEHKSPEEIDEILATYEEKGINQLIEDRLILEAANEKGLEIRGDIIEKRMKEIRERYASEDEFIAMLGAQGLTTGDLKRKLIDQLKAKYTVDLEVRQKIFVNPQDVTKYYNEHAHDFARKTRVNLQSVYISFDKGKEDARNRATEARSRILAGDDFDMINKEYSESPSVGAIEQGQMMPAIEDEIFKLALDQVSGLLEVDSGVYVFKVIGISPGKQETLKDVKDEIYNKLYDQKFQVKFKEWIAKLRKKAYVDIKE